MRCQERYWDTLFWMRGRDASVDCVTVLYDWKLIIYSLVPTRLLLLCLPGYCRYAFYLVTSSPRFKIRSGDTRVLVYLSLVGLICKKKIPSLKTSICNSSDYTNVLKKLQTPLECRGVGARLTWFYMHRLKSPTFLYSLVLKCSLGCNYRHTSRDVV